MNFMLFTTTNFINASLYVLLSGRFLAG